MILDYMRPSDTHMDLSLEISNIANFYKSFTTAISPRGQLTTLEAKLTRLIEYAHAAREEVRRDLPQLRIVGHENT